MIRRTSPTEHQIQSAIVDWTNSIKFHGMIIRDFLVAIPNGGNRSITEAVRLKKEGVKKGVSDLFLAIPVYLKYNSIKSGLWIEVKSKNGKLSKDQKKWMKLMNESYFYSAVVVYSVDEGIQAIKDYLGIK